MGMLGCGNGLPGLALLGQLCLGGCIEPFWLASFSKENLARTSPEAM
jgi:hypothetical protein